jgi:hypothetical protein
MNEVELEPQDLEVISELLLRECKAFEEIGFRTSDDHAKYLRELFLKVRKLLEND